MDYSVKKIPELKTLCKERNLLASGNKAILIERLGAYDKKCEEEKNRFKVFVKTLVGSCYTIYLDRSSSILELKQKIEEKNGCPVNQQVLYSLHFDKEKLVEDDRTLSDYNIYNESYFRLHIRFRAKD